ncbi:hypothetical protein ACG7TL_008608 [Trametes sanguinea]
MDSIVYSPSPGTYVVIRLNPVEMVRHLDDPVALAEAQAMRTKSHLVILEMELALPFPNRPWYRFDVHSIAPCLRDEVPQKGLTSDMCIPIFPNTSHPNGRAPVHPEPEGLFPYTNCYHWYQPIETTVRVRARPEEFDETNAVSLSAFTLTRMDFSSWEEDCTKMCANLDALEAAALTSQIRTATQSTTLSCPIPSAVGGTAHDSYTKRVLRTGDGTSTYSGSGSTRTVDSDNYSDYSGDFLGPINPFSAPDEDVELVPLVDVWVSELADHLKQEDIPHPSELVAEVEQLTGPSPGTYVVLRLNPVEMVRHLDDPIAIAEAREMRTKSHLVILEMERALPFPNRPWYRFDVHSIAPRLRDEEPQKGLTSDMCIPIFPNTSHPNGRAPVHPEPAGLFPYSNCYHWYKPVETTVRIRSRPEEFDETNAASLSSFTLTRMMFTSWREDGWKMGANLDALEAAAAVTSPTQTAPQPTTPSRPIPSDVEGAVHDAEPHRVLHNVHVERPDDDSISTYSGSGSTRTVDSYDYSDYSGDVLGPIDPFSAPDEDVELVPLVDVWVSELAEHLKQEDIPHPSELVAEVEQLTGHGPNYGLE